MHSDNPLLFVMQLNKGYYKHRDEHPSSLILFPSSHYIFLCKPSPQTY